MTDFTKLSKSDLTSLLESTESSYKKLQSQNLSLDMTRGKPSSAQLDLSNNLLTNLTGVPIASNNQDCRNYGGLEGLPEARKLFGELLEVPSENVVIGGNSSLTLMHDFMVRGMLYGFNGSVPWSKVDGGIKWLCPAPGYDRHYGILDKLGIQMIVVETNENGPNMDVVEDIVSKDASVKGIWCVPKYNNPTGSVYSDEVVERLAKMKTAADDFRVVWDNAYTVHHLYWDNLPKLKNIWKCCKEHNHPDRVVMFASTSKITFASAGISGFATSKVNIEDALKGISKQSIGPNKINQLRHCKFLKNLDGILEHMKKHAQILTPKFEAVLEIFEKELGGKNIATWTKPRGGYFVTLYTMNGCAKEVVRLAGEAGVALTPAGATYPHGNDPNDSCLRIAPSLPPKEDLIKATQVLSVCVQLAALKVLLKDK